MKKKFPLFFIAFLVIHANCVASQKQKKPPGKSTQWVKRISFRLHFDVLPNNGMVIKPILFDGCELFQGSDYTYTSNEIPESLKKSIQRSDLNGYEPQIMGYKYDSATLSPPDITGTTVFDIYYSRYCMLTIHVETISDFHPHSGVYFYWNGAPINSTSATNPVCHIKPNKYTFKLCSTSYSIWGKSQEFRFDTNIDVEFFNNIIANNGKLFDKDIKAQMKGKEKNNGQTKLLWDNKPIPFISVSFKIQDCPDTQCQTCE